MVASDDVVAALLCHHCGVRGWVLTFLGELGVVGVGPLVLVLAAHGGLVGDHDVVVGGGGAVPLLLHLDLLAGVGGAQVLAVDGVVLGHVVGELAGRVGAEAGAGGGLVVAAGAGVVSARVVSVGGPIVAVTIVSAA